ncbi:hypothetical protein ACFTQ7_06635 [Lysinibacillus sp. NPDC056959]|uniref:hypothetical protein n=1 Tax=Lysinibacillus sp. NPDC056959 TaxID=3345981 RepID=UPI003628549A
MSICGARQEPLLVVLILVVEYVSYRVRTACKGYSGEIARLINIEILNSNDYSEFSGNCSKDGFLIFKSFLLEKIAYSIYCL